MAFNTYNGVFAEEKKLGQKIEIDCEMDYPIETMVKTDELGKLSVTLMFMKQLRSLLLIITTI